MKQKLLLFFILLAFYAPAQTTVVDSIFYGGIYRTYRLYVPAVYTAGTAVPVVLNLHGYTSNAVQQQYYGSFMAIADTADFLVLHPNGTNTVGGQFWNAGYGPSPDDIGFLQALLDSVALQYTVDEDRVYTVGMSNGGIMSYYMSCELYDRFAAMGSVTGSMTTLMYSACNPARPVPVIEVHGTSDGTVPYNGGSGFVHMDTVIKFWAQHNHTNLTPVVYNYPNIATGDFCTATEYAYLNGDMGSEVVLVKITGGGHTWPGAPVDIGVTNHDMDASIRIWQFFMRFKRSQFVSVQENEREKTVINVYPNPVTGLLTVKGAPGTTAVEVYNLQGNRVYTGSSTGPMFTLDVSAWTNGVYCIRVGGAVNRFVKQ